MNIRPRFRYLWWILCLLALAIPVVIVWFQTPEEQAVALADGRQFKLKAMTFGREHKYFFGRTWLRIFDRVLPPRWLARGGLQVVRQQGTNETLLVWGEWSGTVTSTSPGSVHASVRDVAGIEGEPVPFKVTGLGRNRQVTTAWEFENFPRRSREIDLRIYERGNDNIPHRIGEVSVRNPAGKKYPQWRALALPQRVIRNDGEFVLSEMITGETPAKLARSPWARVAPWTVARFQVLRQGSIDNGWRVAQIETRDATGNYELEPGYSFSLLPNPLTFAFNTPLWSSEKAFKLNVEFIQTANFAPDELFRTRPIVVPVDNGETGVVEEINRQGTVISVRRLSRQFKPAIRLPGALHPRGDLDVALSPPLPGLYVNLVKVEDDRGRVLRHEDVWSMPGGQYRFGIELPADGAAVVVTLAVHRSRWVEFVAEPANKVRTQKAE